MKKLLSGLISVISILVILFSVFVLLNVVMTKSGDTPNVAGFSMLRVITGSMEPTLSVDSVIIVRRTDPAEIKVGDIISFYSADPALSGAVNTHRVVEITTENGYLVYATRGDANLLPDDYPTYEKDLIGKVVFSSRFLGRLIRLFSNPLIFLPFVILPLLVLIIVNLVKTVQSTREIMRREEEEAIREALENARRKKSEQKTDSQ